MEQDFPLFPTSASTVSGRVDLLYWALVSISAFFVVLISALVVVFAVRYRRSRHGAVAEHIPGSWTLEVTWTAVPLAIVMTIFAVGARIYFDQGRPPAGAMEITVVGKQWMWKLQHPDGVREINDLHVARGQPVKLTMTSQDVIHSFYIPAFRVKRDVLPGRYTGLWFEATRTGAYHIFCAEYCGTKHSRMIGTIHVMEPADHEAWLASAARGQPPREAGERPVPDLDHGLLLLRRRSGGCSGWS
jgi:cytochrome c oxidase subunit II